MTFQKIRAYFVSIIESVIYAMEKIIVLSCLIYLIIWAFKIFVIGKDADVEKAKTFVIFCSENWIGLLVFIPFMFYRIIIQKLQELSEVASAKFRPAETTEVKKGDASSVGVE